ncbi:major capsid protein [Microviridae sp.]|nr:major capsid protein [Microviridae sp.]
MENNKDGIPRFLYDHSGYVATVGKCGRLQTAFTRYVVAGSTVDITYATNLRLSPLVRPMYADVHVHIAAYFQPMRHIYGSDWTNFILQGQDESVTFTTRTLASGRNECLGQHYNSGDTIPLWAPQIYINIFNNYYILPGDTKIAANVFDSLNHAIDDRMDYGFQCGWPDALPWNTIVLSEVTTADYRVALTDTNTTLDLLNVEEMKGRLTTERAREWYAPAAGLRYRDIMRYTYGNSVNTDADARPELLGVSEEMLSGFDINATDLAGLGTVGGKSVGQFGLNIPPKFFPEHGVIFVMLLVRFQSLHDKETCYFGQKSNPTYKEISGDPEICSHQAPVTNNTSEWIKGVTLTSAGIMPFGQQFRYGHNRIHQRYRELTGHPFCSADLSDIEHVKYQYSGQWDSVFQSTEAAHWNAQGWADVMVKSVVPPPMVGVFSGVR